MHAEASVRPSDQEHGDLPPSPEGDEGKIDGEYDVVVARYVEGRIHIPSGRKVMQQERSNGETENKPHQFASAHTKAPARIKGIQRESKMDRECPIEGNGSRHAVPDEI